MSARRIYQWKSGNHRQVIKVILPRILSVLGSKGGMTLFLDVQGWDYLPLLDNNFLYEGMVMQVTYTGSIEVGQWISLLPGNSNYFLYSD